MINTSSWRDNRPFARGHRFIAAAVGTILSVTAFCGIGGTQAAAEEPVTKASVIMYHRFGEGDYPSTNVTMEQFRAHIEELKSGEYHVASLPEIVAALRDGKPLPPKTVGLSVDDAYASVFTEAWPLLKEAGFPLTVFVATDPVDKGFSRYMSWDQIRKLAEEGVTIGSQTAAHPHMADISSAEVQQELESSNARFEKELGAKPDLFAYPFGEANNKVVDMVREAGFVASFGQHSGAIGTSSPLFYLPRFAMNEAYGSLDRFKLAANALPLSVSDLVPNDPSLSDRNPPNIGMTVTWPKDGLDRIKCYSSHTDQLDVQLLGTRLEVRMTEAMPKGRTRVNCTLPAGNGRWHWFGWQYYVGR